MGDEKEEKPAWMRYMPRTGWTTSLPISSQEPCERGRVASEVAVKSSNKFSTTALVMTTRGKAKEGNQNIRKVAHKAQTGKVKKNNNGNGSSIRSGNKAQTSKLGSDLDLKQRRRKYGSNVNISEISELVSMSNLTQR